MEKQAILTGLYGITDSRLTPDESLLTQVEQALQGGATIIQYRDKSRDSAKRQRQALGLLALCNTYNATFIINDDVELAAAVNAHGVHLGLSDTAIGEARSRLGPDAIIGGTCHGDISNAWRAREEGADYVAFGRFFPSDTKPDAPLARLEDIAPGLQTLGIPAVAIGGITLANAPQLRAAGFAMVAVVADIFTQPDIRSHCARYAEIFKENQQD